MELPSKLLEQIAFNTRPKIEEHMVLVMKNSTHEENLIQPLHTNNKDFKVGVTYLTGYNGIQNNNEKYNRFYYITPNNLLREIILPPGNYAIVLEKNADDIPSFQTKIKELKIEIGDVTEENYPFLIKPNYSNNHSIIEIANGWQIDFTQDNTIRDVLGFTKRKISEEVNFSENPVEIINFDNVFIETNIAKGMIIDGKRTEIIHNFTTDVNPGYRYIEKFRGGIQWYMIENKDFISNISVKLKNENGNLVSFNGQEVTFRLSIRKIKKKTTISLK